MRRMISKVRSRREGFTLMEVLLVMILIGILAAIAIPRFDQGSTAAYLASMKTDANNAIAGVLTHLAAYNEIPTGTVDASSSADGAMTQLGTSGQSYFTASPYNTVTIAADSSCSNGFSVTVTSSKVTDKQVSYDSCTDAAVKVEAASQ